MNTPTPKPVSRRRVVQGIAWTTPAIAATVAAPAFAASGPCDAAVTWTQWMLDDQGLRSLSYDAATNTWTLSGVANTKATWENGDPNSVRQFDYWRDITYKNGTTIRVGVEPNPDGVYDVPEVSAALGPGQSFSYTAKGAGPLADVVSIVTGDYDVILDTPASTNGSYRKRIRIAEIDPDGCGFDGASAGPCDPAVTWTEWLATADLPLSFDPDTGTWTYVATGDPKYETSAEWVHLVYQGGEVLKVGVVVGRDSAGEPILPENMLKPGEQYTDSLKTALPLGELSSVGYEYYRHNKGAFDQQAAWTYAEISPDGCGFVGSSQPPCDQSEAWEKALAEGLPDIPLIDGFGAKVSLSYVDGSLLMTSTFADGFASSPQDPATIILAAIHSGAGWTEKRVTASGTTSLPIDMDTFQSLSLGTAGTGIDGKNYTNRYAVYVDSSCSLRVEWVNPNG